MLIVDAVLSQLGKALGCFDEFGKALGGLGKFHLFPYSFLISVGRKVRRGSSLAPHCQRSLETLRVAVSRRHGSGVLIWSLELLL